jgi:hypothetical protein
MRNFLPRFCQKASQNTSRHCVRWTWRISTIICMYRPLYACIDRYMHVSTVICMYRPLYACIDPYMHVSTVICMYRPLYACIDHYMHVSTITDTCLSADKSYRNILSPSSPVRLKYITCEGSIACCTTLNQQHSAKPADSPAVRRALYLSCASNTRRHCEAFQQLHTWSCTDRARSS